ncbi:MAG TPA: DUF4932 domain-containing protein [Saprospiraceae bacterium]|nr:DUF4932 domain-containing protein [Saprospiraceae bacterium]
MKNITLCLLFCCALAGMPAAQACSCIGESPVKDQLKQMDAVVVGTVVASEYVQLLPNKQTLELIARDSTQASRYMREIYVAKYTVLVEKIYKGMHIRDTVYIYSGRGGGDCGYKFKTEERYIIYGEKKSYFDGLFEHFVYPEGKNIYWTNICLRTTEYNENEIKELEKHARKNDIKVVAPPYSDTDRKNNAEKSKIHTIEIPEVQELMFVLFALTPTGQKDSVMINHQSGYYQRVMNYFKPYTQERIVELIDRKITTQYNQLRMDASNYQFDAQGKLKRSPTIHNLSWGKRDFLAQYVSELEKFALKSNFRQFYQNNSLFYDSLKTALAAQAPVERQWIWLESHFTQRYHQYHIIFSPLSQGRHSTNRVKEEVFIFVSGPTEGSGISYTLLQARDTRMLFTEIDHNYVNPVSDTYLRDINKAFKSRDKWAAGKYTGSYASAYALFNEYMTWSVFSLYALDNFSKTDYEIIKKRLEDFMIHYRGFVRFDAFNNQLIALYQSRGRPVLISDLYPEMLQWCEKQ